jgi:hypothetical protein
MTEHEMFLNAIKALSDRRYGPSHVVRYSTGEINTRIGTIAPRILDLEYSERWNKTFFVKERKAA